MDEIIGKKLNYPKGQERQPYSVDFWPGEYIIFTKEDWDEIRAYIPKTKKEKLKQNIHPPILLDIPDSGPRICPECGLDNWLHKSQCGKLR